MTGAGRRFLDGAVRRLPGAGASGPFDRHLAIELGIAGPINGPERAMADGIEQLKAADSLAFWPPEIRRRIDVDPEAGAAGRAADFLARRQAGDFDRIAAMDCSCWLG